MRAHKSVATALHGHKLKHGTAVNSLDGASPLSATGHLHSSHRFYDTTIMLATS